MGRVWEYESRTSQRDSRRAGFLRGAQTSGFHKMLRDSLISRGMDPDIIPNLSAPPSVTKPVDREVVKDVVPSNRVQAAEIALQTKPRTTFIETEEPEKESGGGFLKKALGEVAGVAGDILGSAPVKTALSILDIADIPRREVGKPIARALLEPLALATEAADAISPDNLSVLPRIFPTGGQLRGATAVEVLSFITDPINLIPGIGFTKMAHLRGIAKVALKGGRLSLKDTQLLRKVTPVARQMLVKEAAEKVDAVVVPAFDDAVAYIRMKLPRLSGMATDIKLVNPSDVPGGVGKFDVASRYNVADNTVYVARYSDVAAEDYVESIAHELIHVRQDWRQGLDDLTQLGLAEYAKAPQEILADRAGKTARRSFMARERTETATKLGAEVVENVPVGKALTGPEAARRILGKDLPGTRAISREEVQALTAKVPIHESNTVKNLRNTVAGEGHNPPPPPPPRLPGEPPGLLPGGQAPSKSLWRTIESGLFLSPQSSDLMRKTAEIMGDAPGVKLFMKAFTGPAALARVIPEMRAGVVYRRLQSVMEAELGQRLVGQEEAFHAAFQLGRDTSKVVWQGTELAFGDVATAILKGPRIGAKHGKFAATPAQRSWVLTQKALMDDLARQYEHVSGEQLRLLGDDYWPRFVQGDDGRVTIKGRVGAKQSPVKDRKIAEMEDAINRGVPYASPTETVQLYGRAIQKMIRDKMLIQVVKEDKIGRPVIKQLTQQIKALKSQIKSAKPTTATQRLEVEVLRNKAFDLQAIRASKRRSLVPAKQVLGPGFGKELLEPDAAKVMQDIIGPGLGGKVGKGLRGATYAASIPRFVVTGLMDVGQFFIQGATLLATDPVAWSRVVGHSLISLVSPQHWSNYLKNSPEAIEAAKYGIGRGGIEFLEITKRSAALGRAPGAGVIKAVFGAAPRSFETFIEGSRIFNFNSLARIQRGAVGKATKGLPTTGRAAAGVAAKDLEGELFRLAGYVKTKLGTTDLMGLGLSTTQRQVESAFLLYSPRYTRSIFGMLGWAMSNGVPARDAQRALGTMLFGGLTAFYGFARATGMSHEDAVERINPTSGGKFLSLPMGGNEFGFGSAYRSSLGFLGQLIREDNLNLNTWASTDNPIFQYLRSRTAPTTGTLLDFIEGEDFMGKEVDLNAFIDDPGRILDYAQGKFLPLNLEALIEARGPLEQRILAATTETVGGRSFPRSSFALFQEAQESVFQEKRILGEKPYIDYDSFEDMSKANAPATAVINTDPRVQGAQERLEHESRYRTKDQVSIGFEKLEETRTLQEQQQLEDDSAFNTDEMAISVWKDNFRGRQGEFFARRDQIVQDFGLKFGTDKIGVNAAIESYFNVDGEDYKNLMTGGIDWDRFFDARDATLDELSPVNLKLVKEYLRRYDTPTVREFRKAQSDLDEYWAIEDLVWSRLRENAEFSPYLNLNDYLADKMQALLDSGVPQNQAASTLSKLAVVSRVTSNVAKLRTRYRLTNPTTDALLVKWYGLTPAKPPGSSRGKRTQR